MVYYLKKVLVISVDVLPHLKIERSTQRSRDVLRCEGNLQTNSPVVFYLSVELPSHSYIDPTLWCSAEDKCDNISLSDPQTVKHKPKGRRVGREWQSGRSR